MPSSCSTVARRWVPARTGAARQSEYGHRIVALGGGTGLPVLLKGLKKLMFPDTGIALPAAERERLTAIVTMGDDGGSSGRLRKDYGIVPPGDIRNCLRALSDDDPRLTSLFDFRFDGEGEMAGHSLGNLILAAMCRIESDLLGAIEWAGHVLNVRGRVLPAAMEPLTLRAIYEDGSIVDGESRIGAVGRRIARVSIRPIGACAPPGALQAIQRADLIVIGPGSLYTSIIPILLIREIAAAIEESRARVAFVLNLMTEPGETDGYSALDFVSAVRLHSPRLRIHDVLINSAPIPANLLEHSTAEGSGAVRVELESLRFLGCSPVMSDQLLEGATICHDPKKLGHAVLAIAGEAAKFAGRG